MEIGAERQIERVGNDQVVVEAGQGHPRQRHRQGREALRRRPGRRREVGARVQPASVAHGIPGPASCREDGEGGADGVTARITLHLHHPAQLGLVDQRDAARQHHQGRRQPRPGHRAFAQIGRDGNDQRQCADHHGRQGGIGQLNRGGQCAVVQDVADQRKLEGFQPVLPAKPSQRPPRLPSQREGDQAEGQVAAEGEHGPGIVGQQQRRHEDHAPDQARPQGVEHADQQVAGAGGCCGCRL